MRLKCFKGPLHGQEFDLVEGEVYVLGREPTQEGAQPILLDSLTVSANHAEVSLKDNSVLIRDLNSRNGIRINRNKIKEAYLSPDDTLELGEFKFVLEDSSYDEQYNAQDATPTPFQQDEPADELTGRDLSNVGVPEENEKQSPIKQLKDRYEKLDFRIKLFGGTLLFTIIAHSLIVIPILQETKKRLFRESFQTARQITENLAQKYAVDLAAEKYHMIDCDVYRNNLVRNNFSVGSVFLLTKEATVACPLGEKVPNASRLAEFMKANQAVDDCDALIGLDGFNVCTLMAPAMYRFAGEKTPDVVGFALIQYAPTDVYNSVKKLNSLRWQTLFLAIGVFMALAFFVQRWISGAIKSLTDQVHLSFTGTTQNVDRLQSFAAFDELVEEVNRLISKANQGVKDSQEHQQLEASFLQTLLQQVLLLEERAVIAIDSDNNILGVSEYVHEIVPLYENYENLHISEAIADPHLQGELMSFLNDLSSSSESLDRALSLSDRVIQARGMPLFVNDEYIASLVLF